MKKLISQNYISENIDFDSEVGHEKDVSSISVSHAIDPILASRVNGGVSLICPSLHSESFLASNVTPGLLSKSEKIVGIWGLNLHPDDDKFISFIIRRKFSVSIKNHLVKLFYSILKNRVLPPSGMILCDSSWVIVSSELFEIALESIDFINKKQYRELNRALPKLRIVDVYENDALFCVIRKITDDEKKDLMICARKIIVKRLNAFIRLLWLCMVNKFSTSVLYGCKENSKLISESNIVDLWMVKLNHKDNIAILKNRRKFSSMIKSIVHDKFSSMLRNKYEFDDGTFIGASSWFRVSNKLIPIAKEEIVSILEYQREELERIISRARVIVDYKVDRDLTSKEKYAVLENIMNITCCVLKILFKRIWDNVITSLSNNFSDTTDHSYAYSEVGCSVKFPIFPINNVVDIVGIESGEGEIYRYDSIKIRLCNEYDKSILSIRKRFSSEINKCISSKYMEIINGGHKFCGCNVGMYFWRNVSKKILPIVRKEIDPIMENERIEINDILLRSSACIFLYDGLVAVRCLTFDERGLILETIMESVSKQVMRNFSRMWNKIIRLSLSSLKNFKENHESYLDNIRLEFVGSLGPIVSEVVDSLPSDVVMSLPSRLEHTGYNLSGVIYEKSHSLFNERGFLDRVNSCLSNSRLVDAFGNYRFINDEEKKYVLKEFMDAIDTDIDCLIKKRIKRLRDLFPTMSMYSHYVGNDSGHE
ncbi:hypothetical protein [Candidatus Ichthyocystis sparus]|uniref:Uncharacterized protein n=1 Tax=Candidatus Ichthyocystis hellenicum TaxID=1561003 RepID=A0A0S4M5Z6_9BURK|nr:hypothetical protein [Candidatus Ichthyocystis sparus]CUT17677.1 hypothetical protein Ark11_0854 [Candidatus Ichthyocystis hellenicum]